MPCGVVSCFGSGMVCRAAAGPQSARSRGVCEGRLSRPIAMAAGAIAKGSGFVAALRQRELLSELDGAVLHCAEELGQLGQALQRVDSLYEQRHYRWQRIKGKLLVPGFVFVLGLLVMPLPALVAGEIDGGDYLGRIALDPGPGRRRSLVDAQAY